MREFTIWIKHDDSLPGQKYRVSEKPHRDVLIGYEEIDVVEEDRVRQVIEEAQKLIVGFQQTIDAIVPWKHELSRQTYLREGSSFKPYRDALATWNKFLNQEDELDAGGDEDPTLWCNCCGAKRRDQCKCPPRADNE